MSRCDNVKQQVLSGTADANVSFDGLCKLLARLGFSERIKGDHHIFSRPGMREIINLQPANGKAKKYQVRQVRNLLLSYGI